MERERQPLTSAKGSPRVTEAQLREVVARIVGAFDPERVILFGSHASGEAGLGSDVDLLVVMENGERPAQRSSRIARVLLDFPFPIDILVRTPEELEHRLRIGDYFIREILRDGRVLYERP